MAQNDFQNFQITVSTGSCGGQTLWSGHFGFLGTQGRNSRSAFQRLSPSPRIGVISNFDSRLTQILEVTKLDSYFDFVLTSHQFQLSKPEAEILKMALTAATTSSASAAKDKCAQVKVKVPSAEPALPQPFLLPSEALHIGDNYKLDFVGAENAGWKAMLVIPPGERAGIPDNALNSEPIVVFSGLKELREEFFARN